jgi:ubiquitin-protein ligase
MKCTSITLKGDRCKNNAKKDGKCMRHIPIIKEVIQIIEEAIPTVEEIIPIIEEAIPTVEEVIPVVEEIILTVEEVIQEVSKEETIVKTTIEDIRRLRLSKLDPTGIDHRPIVKPIIDHYQIYQTQLQPYTFQTANLQSIYKKNTKINGACLNYIRNQQKDLKEYLIPHWNSSIFFASDEDHPHIFKFIITGLIGTPFENGIFLFDGDFSKCPYSPPDITLLTSSKIKFSPNISENGKICLNTWSSTYTILQILLTIQALILVENKESNIQRGTLQYGIINVIKYIDNFEPFQHIIKTHFKLKKNNIVSKYSSMFMHSFDVSKILNEL